MSRRLIGAVLAAFLLGGCASWEKCAGPWRPDLLANGPVDLLVALPVAGCAAVVHVSPAVEPAARPADEPIAPAD